METAENKLNSLFKKAANQEPLLNIREVELLIKNVPPIITKTKYFKLGISGGLIVSVLSAIILLANKGHISTQSNENPSNISYNNNINPIRSIDSSKTDKYVEKVNKIHTDTVRKTFYPKISLIPEKTEITSIIKPIISNNLIMEDIYGNQKSLSDINSKYLILLFYDIDCSHCKVVIKQLQELYNQSNRDMTEIYAVYVGSDSNKWKIFNLKENKYYWINVIDPVNKTNYRKSYQVWMTPLIYLFDENRKIIGSKLSVDSIAKTVNFKENKEIINVSKVADSGKENISLNNGKSNHGFSTYQISKSKSGNNPISIIVENSSDSLSTYPIKNSVTSGIKMIELEKEEYAALGINIISHDIVYSEISEKVNNPELINQYVSKIVFNDSITIYSAEFKLSSSFYNFTSENINFKYISDKLSPVMISYITRNSRFKVIKASLAINKKDTFSKINDQSFINHISTLIPVVVRHSKYGLSAPEDIVFWFESNDTFFNALPTIIGEELRKEYKSIFNSSQDGIIDSKTGGKCTFFELCKSTFKNISKVSVYPNPSHGQFNIRFDLPAKTNLKISLCSIDGKELQNLSPYQEYKQGNHVVSYSLAEKYTEGIYLLLFQTEDGLIRIERILID